MPTCNLSLWSNVTREVRFNIVDPLLYTSFDVSSPVSHVSSNYGAELFLACQGLTRAKLTATSKAEVCVGFCEYFQVQKFENSRVVQGKYPLQDQNMRGID